MHKLKIGQKAPEFSLKDKNGKRHSLKEVKTDFTAVYFYPKDSTPGCTIEAIMFNKHIKDFEKLKAKVIGISGGNEETKKKFCDKNKLEILLLSDSGFEISRKYGVFGEKKFMGVKYKGISRTSFLLDKNKKIIKIYEKVNPLKHVDELIKDIKGL